MAYEPLHHKYRPQTFAKLVGQEAIVITLTNALRQQKIAPAYLFTGARGTGKTSSARILAKSLNCLKHEVPTEMPCGVCTVCRSIANGSALDVIEIDAASNTGVDNIRELIERAQFAPVQCRFKVYIIDEVHMLSTAAFNALLKTLEEPPDRVVFVLATTDPQRVLPTIISRCQRFDYRRIPLEDMVTHLAAIAAQEAIDVTLEAIQLIAQISQGGLRDAQSLLDQLSLLEGEITVERVWDLVGAVPERDLLTLVRAIAQNDPTTVLDQARHLMDRGREPLIVLQNLASFYRDLLIAKTSPNRPDLVAITPSTWVELCSFAQDLDIGTILLGQQHLRASEVQVKNTTQPRLWLEVALMGLLPATLNAQGQGTTQGTVKIAQPTVPQKLVSRPTPPIPPPAPPAPREILPTESPAIAAAPAVEKAIEEAVEELMAAQPVPAQASLEGSVAQPESDVSDVSEVNSSDQVETAGAADSSLDLNQIWQEVLNLVQPFSTQIMLRQQCQLIAFNRQEARIGTKSQPLFKMAKDRLPNVEAAFEKLCNRKIRVSLEVVNLSEVQATSQLQPSSNGLSESSHSPANSTAVRESTDFSSGTPPEAPRTRSTNSAPYSAAAPSSETIPTPQPSYAAEESDAALAQSPWQEEDEVAKAAKSLAQMFNGQIVSWENNLPVEPDPEVIALNPLPPEELDETDADDDVPF
jgi:DNA polymerase-3 subunit gamma/tau